MVIVRVKIIGDRSLPKINRTKSFETNNYAHEYEWEEDDDDDDDDDYDYVYESKPYLHLTVLSIVLTNDLKQEK